jgi:hypothetical protein
MTPELEAHWRYQLEKMTNWGFDSRRDMVGNNFGMQIPDEVAWLREEARYNMHLATAHLRRQAAERGEAPFG